MPLRVGHDRRQASSDEPPRQVRRVGRVQVRRPVELQQGVGVAVAEVAVQAGLEVAAVRRRVRHLDLRARQHGQRHAGLRQLRVEAGDVRQDVGPQQAAVAVTVRRRRDVRDAVAHAEAGHRQRLVR